MKIIQELVICFTNITFHQKDKKMPHSFACLMVFVMPAFLYAQNTEADSISQINNLEEFVVVGHTTKLIDNGISVSPTKREKSTSSDGMMLIERMQIPTLRIDPVAKSVQYQNGDKVTFYINGVEASEVDVQGLNVKAVSNVEILFQPDDPRFNRNAAVVNFVVKNPKDGGYISAMANQSFIYNNGKYQLYGKYSRNKWSFMTGAGAEYLNTSGDNTEDFSTYHFDEIDDIKYNRKYIMTKRRQLMYYSTLQAVRTDANGSMLIIKGGFRTYDNPHIDDEGSEDYNDTKSAYSSTKDLSWVSPYAKLSYYKSLTSKTALNIEGRMDMSFNKQKSAYLSEISCIANRIKENSYNPSFSFDLTTKISDKDRLSLTANGNINIYNSSYSGSADATQHLTEQKYSVRAGWSRQILTGWTSNLSITLPYSYIKVGSITNHSDLCPALMLNSNYKSQDQKHLAQFMGSYNTRSRSLSSMNNIEIEDNQYQGTAGNVYLKREKTARASIMYNFFMNKSLTMSFTSRFEGKLDNEAEDYYYKKGIIYNYITNVGNLYNYAFDISLRINVFDKKITATPSLTVERWQQTGNICPLSFWQPYANLSIDYTPSNRVFFRIYTSTPNTKTYRKGSGGYTKFCNASFSLYGGYNINDFVIYAMVRPFYKYSKTEDFFNANHLDYNSRTLSKDGGRRFEITVKYTIPFGKKTSREDLYFEGFQNSAIR